MSGRIFVTLCLGFLVTGCAVNRGIVDVRIPDAANPQTATAVTITEVTDRRVFQIRPPNASTPSLKNDEIDDPNITSRAIARKRNTFGQALGDIVLPPGRTVQQVTREALEKALKESGYRVVSEGDPGYRGARVLAADVTQFWAWIRPGFAEIAVEFDTQVTLRGDWPVDNDKRNVNGFTRVTGMFAGTGLWKKAFETGLAALVDKMKTVLNRPRRSSLSPIGPPVS